MEIEINDNNLEMEVMNSSVPVLVDIYSDSCAPCKMLYNILSELSNEYSDKMKFCKANMFNNSSLISKFAISSVPTILFFKNGTMVEKKIGLNTKDSLIKDIEKVLR